MRVLRPVGRALRPFGALTMREPAVVIAFVDAVLVLGITAGLPLRPELKAAIDAVLVAAAGVITRSQVSPVKSAQG
jgi:hypothetical protein